jgi:thymidylate synthase (FAD)
MIKVNLIEYTKDPERVVAMSARLCYSPAGAAELVERMTDAQVERLVGKIVSMGHASTMEHVSFTFAMEGVSRVLTHQLVRHRIASYSQQSQRYVAEHDFEYIMPPNIAAKPEAAAKFKALMMQIRTTYNDMVELGVSKEDARYVLANATETKIVATFNARSLMHFFNLRCCNRAQWEIREMAYQMLKEVQSVAPLLFKNAGASCVDTGHCPEGNMTCGKFADMIKMRKE